MSERIRDLRAWAPVALVFVAGVVFILVSLPVSDLQAADARSQAVGRGVGLGYWFSWFGGAIPGRYSILSAWIGELVGVKLAGSAAILGLVALMIPLLHKAKNAWSTSVLVALLGLATLWSGRISFCLGAALAVASLFFLRNGKPWVAGIITVLAALTSPLAAAFAILAVSGWLMSPSVRRAVLIYGAVGAVGLSFAPVLFGAPGPTALDTPTLVKVLVILLVPQLIALPGPARLSLGIATILCVGCFFWPNGVGANISRYALYVMPPMVWFFSPARRAAVVVVLIPAVGYGAGLFVVDVQAARSPAAQRSYYTGIETALLAQPALASHRVEALDTPTHRPSAQLAVDANLARGWDLQADAAANPIFYARQTDLNAATYRVWLDTLAVGWVAVPDDLNAHNRAEAALIAAGLPYLTRIWTDRHWSLYAVKNPASVVSAPATIVSATPASMVVEVPVAMTVSLRLRPSEFLEAEPVDGKPGHCLLTPIGPLQMALAVDRAGACRIESHFDVAAALTAARNRLSR